MPRHISVGREWFISEWKFYNFHINMLEEEDWCEPLIQWISSKSSNGIVG